MPATLHPVNLHDDVVTTVEDDPAAATFSRYFESAWYGVPRKSAATPNTYSYLGGKQRSTDPFGNPTLMGIRLYNPTTDWFLSTDPIPGGNT